MTEQGVLRQIDALCEEIIGTLTPVAPMPAEDDQCFVSVVAAEKDLRKAVDSEEECASLVGLRRVGFPNAPPATAPRFDPRTRLLLDGSILRTLLRLATPKVVHLYPAANSVTCQTG
jgi:hypothetical protein